MNQAEFFGLKQHHLEVILDTLNANQHIENAWIFGSRAIGSYHDASDIDLAISGKDINLTDVAQILDALEHTSIPYKFDVLDISQIKNENLLAHIRQYGIALL